MTIARIGLANLRFPASIDDGVARARAAIEDTRAAGAAIVCFPESYVPGYRVPFDPAELARAWDAIAAAARDAHVAVVLGTERIADGTRRISALVIDERGERLGFQDKVQLDPSEDDAYAPGAERRVFRCGPLTFGVAICHEGWRYPETVRAAARAGAQLVFHPHYAVAEADGFRPATFLDPRNTFHEQAMRCRAAENTIYFASVNYAEDGAPTTSAIVDPDGGVVAWQPYGRDGVLVAELDLARATGFLASRCRS